MTPSSVNSLPDHPNDIQADFVQLARAALLSGGYQATPLIRRFARRYRDSQPKLATELITLLRETPVRAAGVAMAPISQPVDKESRLQLVREEDPVILRMEPIFPGGILTSLEQIAEEHEEPARLIEAGLTPTRTTLFIGPPGVGKTLAARWLAARLNKPLIVLDLASVMSSLLGRTGENVRRVLDYAKQTQCVLLLDELDAVAKRRDDVTEIGELKRLVTVLLQEIDMWPEGSLLLAATNHAELLDPAVWRRFEVVLDFPLPDETNLSRAMRQYLDDDAILDSSIAPLASLFIGASYSDLERSVMRARRISAMQGLPIELALEHVTKDRLRRLPTSERIHLAAGLAKHKGISQRRANEITGVSRDTLRKYLATDFKIDEGVLKSAR